MERVIADTELLQKLDGGNKSVDVCDATGQVLGRYMPEDDYRRLITDWAFAIPSAEAREAARKELETGGGFSTTEIAERFAQIRLSWKQKP